MPALLISTSMGPASATVEFTRALTCSSLVTSQGKCRALPPESLICFTVSSREPWATPEPRRVVLADATTVAPALARPTARALPIPAGARYEYDLTFHDHLLIECLYATYCLRV